MKWIYVLFVVFVVVPSSWSQTKNEKEERVQLEALPEAAIPIVNRLSKQLKRLRFYKETDGEKQSFEAKFKHNKQHYSIEFSREGIIEDIEILINEKQLKKEIKSNIDAFYRLNFRKSKLIKIQMQYVYNRETDPNLYVESILSGTSVYKNNYEIIAEVKNDTQRQVCEYLFNAQGDFVGYRTLNSDSYEHVLH